MNQLFFFTLLPISLIAQERPNIIYIITDQQTATAMSCMNNTDIYTPNMDRLAQSGIIFNNAYCATPLSAPSRTAMCTGYFAQEINMGRNTSPLTDSVRSTSLGVLMEQSGYDCQFAGKWHVGTSHVFGFNKLCNSAGRGLAEACVKYLDQKHDKPFFLIASFMNPHNICQYARHQNLPDATLEERDLKDCPGLPYNFYRNPYDADVIMEEKKKWYFAYPTINYTPEDWRRYRNAYFRLVENVDKEIGKIVDALDRNNLWENSVVIFSSDHGDGMGAHQWNQKSALYEETVNIPLIVTLPGKKNAGKRLPQLINNGVDFYASICDWAGIKMPEGRHGKSYKDLVEKGDEKTGHQDYIVIETMFDSRPNPEDIKKILLNDTRGWVVRTGNYKYVLYDKGRYREQLFDMNKDRGEMRNLAVESAYDSVLKQHRDILRKWMKIHRAPVNYIPNY